MGVVHQHYINRLKGANDAKISMSRHSCVLYTDKLWSPEKHSIFKHADYFSTIGITVRSYLLT